MDETKEIEFQKIVDLLFNAVDFDYFDDYKYLSFGFLSDPTNEYGGYIIYFYGYSLMTSRIWFYNDIFIRNGKLDIYSYFFDKWEKHPCEKKEFQMGALKKLKEICDKRLTIINIPKEGEGYGM